MKRSKATIRLITHAVTGHASLNRHLALLGLADSPMCRMCGEGEETAAHVLDVCPALAVVRAKAKGSWQEALGGEGETWSVQRMVSYLQEPSVEALFQPK